MRLSIRLKMFILVMVVLLGATSAIVYKTRGIFFEDKFDFVKQLSSKLASSTSKLVSDRLIGYQGKLASFVSTRESLKKVKSNTSELNLVLFERQPEFLAVSLQKMKGDSWGTEWIQINSNKDASGWPESYTETVLRSLNYKMEPGLTYVFRVVDPSGIPVFAISMYAEVKAQDQSVADKNAIVGFVSKEFLSDAVVEYKADLNSVYVIDKEGYLVSFPDQSQAGNLWLDDVIVKEIVETKRDSATGEYTDKSGEKIVASYQPIPQTNLISVASTPMKQAMEAAKGLMWTIIVFGLGFLIIGLSIAFYIASKITSPIRDLQKTAAIIGSGDFKMQMNIQASDEVGDLAKSIDKMRTSLIERDEQIEGSKQALIQSEKMSAFGQLSAGIAHEVKNPLAGILGHAQLAKSKVKDPDLIKHMDVIEKEARRTKEIVENLMKFARAEKPELVATDIHETVSRTVDLVDHQLSLMGVKIHKHLDTVPLVMANANQIQQVLLNLMMNAGHAMEESKTKELHVYTEDAGEFVRIRIRDTGKGMPPEVKKKLFEPFFTTKPPGKGTGLGLSVSFGIIRDHKGKIWVESEAGQGATFFIDLPKKDSAAANAAGPVETIPNRVIQTDTKSFEKSIQDFDSRRGVVTNDMNKVAQPGDVPKLDLQFKAPKLDPEKAEETKTGEMSEKEILRAQELMYGSSKKTESVKVSEPPAPSKDKVNKMAEETKVTEITKVTDITKVTEVTKTQVDTAVKDAASSSDGEKFKVKIRKPNVKV